MRSYHKYKEKYKDKEKSNINIIQYKSEVSPRSKEPSEPSGEHPLQQMQHLQEADHNDEHQLLLDALAVREVGYRQVAGQQKDDQQVVQA